MNFYASVKISQNFTMYWYNYHLRILLTKEKENQVEGQWLLYATICDVLKKEWEHIF